MTDETPRITISEGLSWLKTLKERHKELVSLRDSNSKETTTRWGETKEDKVEKPTYDVRELDRLVTRVAIEIRHLDDAIKYINNLAELQNYTKDESVLGEV